MKRTMARLAARSRRARLPSSAGMAPGSCPAIVIPLLLLGAQAVLGFSLGLVMPSSLVTVQNAAERRDIGAATGCLLFLRSMGGAFGSTLVGAILAAGFASELARLGITAHIELGEVRQHGGALAGITPAMMPQVQVALADAFHWAFLACAIAMAVAVAVALGMRDLPLRTASAHEPPAEPAALAH